MLDFRYKTKIKDIQDKYKFKIFCYDATGTSIADFNANAAQKTQEFNQNAIDKTNDFDEHASSIQAELEEVQQELEKAQQDLSMYKMLENALPKVGGEGETISLDKTAKSPMSLTLKGNIEQDGEPTPTNPQDIHIVSGDNEIKVQNKNFFDKTTAQVGGINRDTGALTTSTSFRASQYIKVIPNETYYIQNGNPYYAVWYDKDKNYISPYNSNGANVGTAPINAKYIRFATEPSKIDTTMFFKGSTATSYVEHKEYTKEINLPVENLLHTTLTSQTKNNVNVVVNDDGTIILNGTSNAVTWLTLGSVTLQAGTYTMSQGNTDVTTRMYSDMSGYTSNGIKTFTIDETKTQNVSINIPANTTLNNLVFKPQIEKGTKKNSFTPYGTTPIEVGGIGDYEDEFFKNTTDNEYYDSTLELDKWYLKKRIGKVVLDGSEAWYLSTSSSNYYEYGCGNIIVNGKTGYSNCISNYFSNQTDNRCLNNGTSCLIRTPDTTITTANAFKTWLSTHNTKVYYVLATPENILLNDTLQETLDSFYSWQEQTNISQTNNDLPFVIKASAIYDLSNLLPSGASLTTSSTASLNKLEKTDLKETPLEVENIEEKTSEE